MDAATALLYAALSARSEQPGTVRAGVINAVATAGLKNLAERQEIEVTQLFKSDADALTRIGITPACELDGCFDAVAVRPSKNKVQTLSWLAAGLLRLKSDGVLLTATGNSHGARSLEQHLAGIGDVSSESKSKCRLMALHRTDAIRLDVCEQWLADAAPVRQGGLGLWSCPGLFSWETPDAGSSLLLGHLPDSLSGNGMDLCCGYGLLGHALMDRHAAISHLHMVDADRLALQMAERNVEPWRSKTTLHWLDAAAGPLPQGLDWVVCNPPFHEGQAHTIGLGQKIVASACASLRPGGTLWLVANRKLPYETVITGCLRHARVVTQEQGYKIMTGMR